MVRIDSQPRPISAHKFDLPTYIIQTSELASGQNALTQEDLPLDPDDIGEPVPEEDSKPNGVVQLANENCVPESTQPGGLADADKTDSVKVESQNIDEQPLAPYSTNEGTTEEPLIPVADTLAERTGESLVRVANKPAGTTGESLVRVADNPVGTTGESLVRVVDNPVGTTGELLVRVDEREHSTVVDLTMEDDEPVEVADGSEYQFDDLLDDLDDEELCSSFANFDDDNDNMDYTPSGGEEEADGESGDGGELESEAVEYVKTVAEMAKEANISDLFDPKVLGKL